MKKEKKRLAAGFSGAERSRSELERQRDFLAAVRQLTGPGETASVTFHRDGRTEVKIRRPERTEIHVRVDGG